MISFQFSLFTYCGNWIITQNNDKSTDFSIFHMNACTEVSCSQRKGQCYRILCQPKFCSLYVHHCRTYWNTFCMTKISRNINWNIKNIFLIPLHSRYACTPGSYCTLPFQPMTHNKHCCPHTWDRTGYKTPDSRVASNLDSSDTRPSGPRWHNICSDPCTLV